MEYIDLETWPRKTHFEFFHSMDYPHFNICVNLDVTHFLSFVKEHKLSFYYSMGFTAATAANEIENFRYRIRGDRVVLHDKVHPSFTVLDKGSDLFKIVSADLTEDILSFTDAVKAKSAHQHLFLDSESEARDDRLYFTSVPWFSFTQLTHPIDMKKDDSVPRISWGKYFRQGDKVLMPFSVQANHALMDGFHAGKYIDRLQKYLDSL